MVLPSPLSLLRQKVWNIFETSLGLSPVIRPPLRPFGLLWVHQDTILSTTKMETQTYCFKSILNTTFHLFFNFLKVWNMTRSGSLQVWNFSHFFWRVPHLLDLSQKINWTLKRQSPKVYKIAEKVHFSKKNVVLILLVKLLGNFWQENLILV